MLSVIANDLVTRAQAAEYLGVQIQTLAVWACSGRYDLPVVRIGRCVRYRLRDLENFIERRTVRSGTAAGA